MEHSTRGNVPNKICAEQRVAEALLETLGSWLQIQPRFFLKARQTEGDFSGHFAVPSLLWVGVGTLKGKRKKKPGTQCERRSLAGVLVPGLVERNLNPPQNQTGEPRAGGREPAPRGRILGAWLGNPGEREDRAQPAKSHPWLQVLPGDTGLQTKAEVKGHAQ